MVNETNILNLIAKNPAQPEPSFQVSHFEQSDHERFDDVLQAEVDSPQDEPRFASSKPLEAKNNTNAEISRNNSTATVNPDKGHSETSHPAPVNPSDRPVALNDEEKSGTSHSEQGRSNSFTLPLALLADGSVPAGNNALQNLIQNNQPTTVGSAVAGIGVSEEGAAALDAFRQQLVKLNIDPETIDQLVEALQNGDAAGLQGILNALRGLLQAAGQVGQAQTLENVSEGAANRLNQTEQRAINLLVQAGLTLEEAQQVIQQVRVNNASQAAQQVIPQTQTHNAGQPATENAAQLSKALADSIAAKANAEPAGQTGTSQNTSGNPNGSTGKSSASPRSFSGLASDQLETLASLVSPDKPSNTGNVQTNPLIANTATSPLLNQAGAQPAQGILADGTPGQAPAALADAASRGVDFAKPAITETYNGRASMDKPITAQIIEKITLRGFGNQREINIKLDPPSLGTVRMNISTNGETVRATIVAENNIVKSIIENNLSQLKDSITHQGVKIDNFSVLVGGDASHSAQSHKDALEYFGHLRQAGSTAQESGETHVTLHRPVFLSENQSISIFA